MDYKDAGVDIEKGDEFVSRIKKKVLSTYNDHVTHGVGGFSCLYEITPQKYLAAGTDGVGTKIKLAIELDKHDTIGIDLVAMCVNDVLCTGATPLFFMDYMASSQLNLKVSEDIIAGIVHGCQQSSMALIGGETAEMPGMYQIGDYDLAGFCVGEVLKENVIDGQKIASGDKLVAISSSGFHSNGYSLLRRLIVNESRELKEKLLTPTRIYHSFIEMLLKHHRQHIHGISHITGGGLDNVKRMNESFNYDFNNLPSYSSVKFKGRVCDSFDYIAKKSKLSEKKLYQTFNMGMGIVIATDDPRCVLDTAREVGVEAWEIGLVR
jgi:phosphoribosylformylglycinamidine cyclo-ligase